MVILLLMMLSPRTVAVPAVKVTFVKSITPMLSDTPVPTHVPLYGTTEMIPLCSLAMTLMVSFVDSLEVHPFGKVHLKLVASATLFT